VLKIKENKRSKLDYRKGPGNKNISTKQE